MQSHGVAAEAAHHGAVAAKKPSNSHAHKVSSTTSSPHKSSDTARKAHQQAIQEVQKKKEKEREHATHNGGTQIDEDVWQSVTEALNLNRASTFVRDDAHLPLCDRRHFNIFIGCLILVNAIVMGLETDLKEPDGPQVGWQVMANLFTFVWVSEVILRLKTHKLNYFKDGWNVMDFALATLSVLDTWILALAGGGEGLRSFGPLRILRIVRLVRLVRLMRAFKELWLIVHGMIAAIRTLSWVCVLMGLILYIGAIFVTEEVGKACDEDYADFADCSEMFSSVFRSVYTLFQVITLESWSMAVARPVIRVQPVMVFFFLFFLFITTFGLLNVVVGVIVESTLAAARSNEETLAKVEEEKRQMELRALRVIFERADEDGSGTLNLQEFIDVCESPEAVEKFLVLDLPVDNALELFMIIDDNNSGQITIDEFISGCLKLKGAAKAKDLAIIVMDIKTVKKRLERIESTIGAMDAEAEEERLRHVAYLRSAFQSIDVDQSGGIERSEFERVVEMPSVLEHLQACDIEVTAAADYAKELFDLLDADGSGEIDIDEFIEGCLRLKGTAKSKDLVSLIVDVKAQRREMAKMFARMDKLLGYETDSHRASHEPSSRKTSRERSPVLNSGQKSALALHGLPVVMDASDRIPPPALMIEKKYRPSPLWPLEENASGMSRKDAAARARADADQLYATAEHLYRMAAMLEADNGELDPSSDVLKLQRGKSTVCCRKR